MWECLCDCGNIVNVAGSALKNGNTKSCGCYKREMDKKIYGIQNKKYNTYDLSGEYGIGYTEDSTIFYFDLEDYDKIKDYYWNNNDGFRVAILGGVWNSGAGCGAWCLYLHGASSDRIRNVGGRLLYVPQTKISA